MSDWRHKTSKLPIKIGSIPCSIVQQATELKPSPKRPIFLTWKSNMRIRHASSGVTSMLAWQFSSRHEITAVISDSHPSSAVRAFHPHRVDKCCQSLWWWIAHCWRSTTKVLAFARVVVHNLGTFLVLMEADSLGLRPSIHVWSEQWLPELKTLNLDSFGQLWTAR